MVHHIAETHAWERAVAGGGPYVPDGYEVDGFVHCSTAEQLPRTLGTWFAGRDDLVVLTIDESLVGSALVMEPGSLGEAELFPHLYSPVELAWVTAVELPARFS